MIPAILGTKLDQSQAFTPEGKRIPVTTIQAGPCWVTRIHQGQTLAEKGLTLSIQLAFGNTKRITNALKGHMKKAGLDNKPRFLREIRVQQGQTLDEKGLTLSEKTLSVGTEIKVGDVFQPGDIIQVTGTSKGKGFAGVVKRHHFAGGPRTHGQSDRERAPGSIGQTTTPGRVYRGKRMAGRMGTDRVTVRHLRVIEVDPQTNRLTIKGVVPGGRRGLLLIQKET